MDAVVAKFKVGDVVRFESMLGVMKFDDAEVVSVIEGLSESAYKIKLAYPGGCISPVFESELQSSGDWAVVRLHQMYDNRDGLCGSERVVDSSHASEAEAVNALCKVIDSFGEDGPGEMEFYVARKSEGLRKRVAAAVELEDIPF